MRRTPPRSYYPFLLAAVCSLATCLASGCVEDGGDAAAASASESVDRPLSRLATEQQAVIFDEEDWRVIFDFAYGNPKPKFVAASYGKAVVSFVAEGNGQCSGFLIDDRHVMTAWHCNDTGSPTFANIVFGQWSFVVGGRDVAGDFARGRLVDLGYDSSSVASLATNDLVSVKCSGPNDPYRFDRSATGRRDIAIWTCGPLALPIGAAGAMVDVDPGSIWGHLRLDPLLLDPVAAGAPFPGPWVYKDGTDTDVLSYNQTRYSSGARAVLLSTVGQILDARDDCENEWSGTFDNCFEHDTDDFKGSSGGAILRDESNTVIGVARGARSFECEENISINESFSNRYWTQNLGTWLPPGDTLPRLDFRAEDVFDAPAPVAVDLIGNGGGTPETLDCPADYAAVGVVGAGYSLDPQADRPVGAFGLVCSPRSPIEVGTIGQRRSFRPTDMMVVLAAGSKDTGYQRGEFDLNQYLNEVLPEGDRGIHSHPQEMTLCRPGHFMHGLSARHDVFINEVTGVKCRDPTGLTLSLSVPRVQLGNRSTGTITARTCPTGSFVVGAEFFAGDVLDGVRLRCAPYEP